MDLETTPLSSAASSLAHRRTSRRSFLSLVAAAPLAGAALAACGSSGPSGSSSGGAKGGASMWYLSGNPNQQIKTDTLKTWNNAHKNEQISVNFFQNDAYKTKIKTAIGAGQAPTMIYSWGGGTLRSYAQAGQVLDLTDFINANPDVKNSVLASTYGAATTDGKIYALPNENASLIHMFYNKDLFKKYNVSIPKTWDDLLNVIGVFNKNGVAPIALAGQSNWTSMMYLEYFFDRVGGPSLFNDIYAGKANAWSNPDAITALGYVGQLLKANAFQKGFQSTTADSNADWALFYGGKAAMMLHGSWSYGGIKGTQPDFVKNSMAWGPFPTITGGKGDPKDVAGNPAQYMSISSKASAKQQKIAKDYFKNGIMDDAVVADYIKSGQVCIGSSAESAIAKSADKDYLSFAFNAVKNAPSFVQSWDQALSPATATTLLTNISQLFSGTITPEKFASNMNPTLGK